MAMLVVVALAGTAFMIPLATADDSGSTAANEPMTRSGDGERKDPTDRDQLCGCDRLAHLLQEQKRVLGRLQHEQRDLADERAEVQATLDRVQSRVDETRRAIRELETQKTALLGQLREIEGKLASITARYMALEDQESVLLDSLTNMIEERQRIASALENERLTDEERARLRARLNHLDHSIASTAGQIRTLEREQAALRSNIGPLQGMLERLRHQLRDVSDRLADLRGELRELLHIFHRVSHHAREIDRHANRLHHRMHAVRESIAGLEHALERCTTAHDRKESRSERPCIPGPPPQGDRPDRPGDGGERPGDEPDEPGDDGGDGSDDNERPEAGSAESPE